MSAERSAPRGRPYNSKAQAHCQGKERIESPKDAHRIAARFRRGTRRRSRRPIDVYRCKYCGGWHLGTPK